MAECDKEDQVDLNIVTSMVLENLLLCMIRNTTPSAHFLVNETFLSA